MGNEPSFRRAEPSRVTSGILILLTSLRRAEMSKMKLANIKFQNFLAPRCRSPLDSLLSPGNFLAYAKLKNSKIFSRLAIARRSTADYYIFQSNFLAYAKFENSKIFSRLAVGARRSTADYCQAISWLTPS